MGGKKFVYDKGREENFTDGDNLIFSVFFDGTQNNKTNTEIGEMRRDEIERRGNESYKRRFHFLAEDPIPERSIPSNEPIYEGGTLKGVKIVGLKEAGDSYENDYTNVARLWKSYKEIEGVQIPIYIEGVGTTDGKKPNEPSIEIKKKFYKDKNDKDIENGTDEQLVLDAADDMAAVGTGVFSTSVRAKARKACDKILEKLDKYKHSSKYFISTLTIDVYGFSRGATTARYFTHFVTCTDTEKEKSKYYENHDISKEVMPIIDHIKDSCSRNFEFWDDETLSKIDKAKKLQFAVVKTEAELIKAAAELYDVVERAYTEELHDYFQQQLKNAGIKVNHINVRFLGLFDTVSSYGLFHDNDVSDLSLDAVNKAQKVIHLAAADEYRKNFALTNIQKAGFKGIELLLPGVHCDVGGAYVNTAYERTAFYITSLYDEEGIAPSNILLGPVGSWIKEALEPNAKKFRNKLIEEGWLQSNQWEFVYKGWLGGGTKAAQSVILTGVIQTIIKNLPNARGINYLKEINEKMFEGMQIGLPPFGILYGHRLLSNKYTFIPLEIMADFSLEMNVPINKSYFASQGWSVTSDLEYTKNRLTQYKNAVVNLRDDLKSEHDKEEIERIKRDSVLKEFGGFITDKITSDKQKKYIKKTKNISYKDFLTNDKELHHLRNNYLHWSAKSDSFGLDPITRSHKFEKTRVIYNG